MSEAEVRDPEPAEGELDQPDSDATDVVEVEHRPSSWPALQWLFLRCWLARGRARSRYWVPRIGDRVRLHGAGTWLVLGVSIRRGEVELRSGTHHLDDVDPAFREDLDELYGTRHWYPLPGAGRYPARPEVDVEDLELISGPEDE